MIQKIKETAEYLKSRIPALPHVVIVLGTGLGGLVDDLKIELEIPYKEIPNFPISTVKGHKGSLIFGKLNNVDVVVQNGRFHFYEGYDLKIVTFPMRVFKAMGINIVLLSNAAGSVNPEIGCGSLMMITDHINFFCDNPLMGPNYEELGPRFPDMGETYSLRLRNIAKETAAQLCIPLKEGIYLGSRGPTFETPAEYRMFHRLGADAVGMSTVPEAIVAHHGGMETFAISIITDEGFEGKVKKASHEVVLAKAAEAGPKMTKLIYAMLPKI